MKISLFLLCALSATCCTKQGLAMEAQLAAHMAAMRIQTPPTTKTKSRLEQRPDFFSRQTPRRTQHHYVYPQYTITVATPVSPSKAGDSTMTDQE